jgi:hypothetical protein
VWSIPPVKQTGSGGLMKGGRARAMSSSSSGSGQAAKGRSRGPCLLTLLGHGELI